MANQQALIDQAIKSGRLASAEDAVKEALELWEERERARLEILSAVERSRESLRKGKGWFVRSHEESRRFAADINRTGLARLEAERAKR